MPNLFGLVRKELQELETRLRDGACIEFRPLAEVLNDIFSHGGKRLRPGIALRNTLLFDVADAVHHVLNGAPPEIPFIFQWHGKEIRLQMTPIKYFGEVTGCILAAETAL